MCTQSDSQSDDKDLNISVSGVNLDFTWGRSVSLGARTFCGVLTCAESPDVTADSKIIFKNISSLSVFKKIAFSYREGTTDDPGVPIASVTVQDDSVTRVANGIKVEGFLKDNRASMRVEFFKPKYCQAEYSCEVHGFDSRGREVVKTAHLVQQPYQEKNQVGSQTWAPATSLQLLSSIQQLIARSRRVTGSVNFDKKWDDYKQGFGSFDGDFWLGNDKIHTMTSDGVFEIKIDLEYKGKSAYAHYDSFYIAGENEKYKLRIGSYTGTAGDSFKYHNNRPFSTIDRDNDAWSKSCATLHGGGWWFGACDHSNLNGKWGRKSGNGVEWEKLAGPQSVSFSEMKIRLK
ncbi:angiopoietin-related protein 1 [Elysia marginata]|uniref:Angiopoietin-related protein 1 n=1 Tax=Elysia marginata TaxID=1093978 RepID=A0AAV4H542_9GAST|nr:angiopoietin-related protein 1 [Elysia marginata]